LDSLKLASVGAVITALTIVASTAYAQQPQADAPVIAMTPVPHAAGCADFSRMANGAWTPTGPVQINHSITMGPGMAFNEGVAFSGIDIAKWLNQNCR
jgi:hypothetical protein